MLLNTFLFKTFITLFLVIQLLFLSACSLTRLSEHKLTSHELHSYLNYKTKINSWHIKGKISVVHNLQGGSLSFDWQQESSDEFTIKFFDATASFVLSVSLNDELYTLTDQNNKKYFARNLKEIEENYLTLNIPIEYLVSWIRGIPYLETQFTIDKYDTMNNIARIYQENWKVDFFYKKVRQDFPNKIISVNTSNKDKIVIINKS